jgi:hypothetical protein
MFKFPKDGEEEPSKTAQKDDGKSVVVVSEEEWTNSIREIIQRDYFPLRAPSAEPAQSTSKINKKLRLDQYFAEHVSEDQVAFDHSMKTSSQEHRAMFSNKKDFLRLVDAPSNTLAIGDAESNSTTHPAGHEPNKTINPENTRMPVRSASSIGRRPMLRSSDRKRDDLELLSTTSRSTARSRSYGRKQLSEKAVELIEQIRKNQRKSTGQ